MLTKNQLKQAYDQNILCFDGDAKEKELTYRLVGIMIDVEWLNFKGRLTDLYIPPGIEWDDGYDGRMCGLKVHRLAELSPGGELYKYYRNNLGASLYVNRNDRYLIVGTGPNDAVMIGSMQ